MLQYGFVLVVFFVTIIQCIIAHNIQDIDQTFQYGEIQQVLNTVAYFDLNSRQLNYQQQDNAKANISQQSILSTWAPLGTLTHQDISLLSTTPPNPLNSNDEFFPFGSQMYFTFTINTNPQQDGNGFVPTADGSEMTTYEFHLEADTLTIGNLTTSPTFSRLNTQSTTPQYYSKYTNFHGKRINEQGKEEKILLAIVSNVAAQRNKNKNNLETQDVNSNLQDLNDFVIEGIFIAADGTPYQITTYEALIHQHNQHIIEAEYRYKNHTEKIKPLSDGLQILQSLQIQSPTGLAFKKMKQPNEHAKCGTKHGKTSEEGAAAGFIDDILHQMEDAVEQEFNKQQQNDNNNYNNINTPLDITPQWKLTPWESCHDRSDKPTLVPFHIYHGYTYRMLMSDGADEIDDAKVEARTRLIVSLFNLISGPQFNVYWSIKGFVNGDGTESWDPNSYEQCLDYGLEYLHSQLVNLRAYNNDTTLESALSHAFVSCSQYDIQGVANVRFLCENWMSAMTSIRTLDGYVYAIHEQFHAVGARHTFEGPDGIIGESGSLMDYYNLRLSDIEPDETDHRQYGFSKTYNWNDICPGFNRAWRQAPISETTPFGPRRWIKNCFQDILPETIGQSNGTTITIINNDNSNNNDTIINDDDNNNTNNNNNTDIIMLIPSIDITNITLIREFVCNHDGVLQPWEQCDPGRNTRCCQNCQLASFATCADTNDDNDDDIPNECCIDCIAVKSSSKRCKLTKDKNTNNKSGICFRGVCIPDTNGCAQPEYTIEWDSQEPVDNLLSSSSENDNNNNNNEFLIIKKKENKNIIINKNINDDNNNNDPSLLIKTTSIHQEYTGPFLNCSDDIYQPNYKRYGTCAYTCPFENCSKPSETEFDDYFDGFFFPTGAFCDAGNGRWGVCRGATPFDLRPEWKSIDCQMFSEGNFTWSYYIIQQCDCAQGIPLIDSYVCLDPSGFPVADEYCDNNEIVYKPQRAICQECDIVTTTILPTPFNITDINGNIILPTDRPGIAGAEYNNAEINKISTLMIITLSCSILLLSIVMNHVI